MRRCAGVALLTLCASCSFGIAAGGNDPFPSVRLPGGPRRYELRNGYWFNGNTFEQVTKYSVYGALSDRQPVPVDSVIDLQGGYVVPAFGEAHNHNAVPSDTGVSNRYLRAGIYYVKNPNNLPADRV